MRAEIADLDWPPDLLDDEEQDEPLAGQDHNLTIQNLHFPLYARLRGPRCFVASELRVHRNRADLRDYLEPDILVAFDVPDKVRRRYLIWEEGKAPDLVLEVLSPSSEDNGDLDRKWRWYRQEGVREYVVLDPSGEFPAQPRLQAWRFRDQSGLGPVAYEAPAAGETLWSALIPFGWRVVDNWVRVVDRETGEVCPTLWEVEPQLRAAVQARQEAQERALRAEERAQLAQERAQVAEEQVRLAAARARLAEEQATAEAAARQRLEAELARLRRQIEEGR